MLQDEVVPRNPVSSAALTRTDVQENLAFICYKPLSGKPPHIQGVFTKSPWLDEKDGWLVEYRDANGAHVTIDLCSLGIGPNSSGTWINMITIAADE